MRDKNQYPAEPLRLLRTDCNLKLSGHRFMSATRFTVFNQSIAWHQVLSLLNIGIDLWKPGANVVSFTGLICCYCTFNNSISVLFCTTNTTNICFVADSVSFDIREFELFLSFSFLVLFVVNWSFIVECWLTSTFSSLLLFCHFYSY